MSSLEINQYRLNTTSPTFLEPEKIGGFSVDKTGNFHNDERSLRFVSLPSFLDYVNFDLNVGYHSAVNMIYTLKGKLDHLLQWIMENKSSLSSYIIKNGKIADFVCYRGTLRYILCTPYEEQEGWIVCAKKMNGTIYLCQFDTPEKVSSQQRMDERSKQMSYWGCKFEHYVTADTPQGRPDTSKMVNKFEEYRCLLRTQLGPFSLLIGAETDGVNYQEQTPASTRGFYEMKTNRCLETTYQESSFKKFKLIKWWAQSYLAGIHKVLCGFRDDFGVVRKLKIYPVDDIPAMAQGIWEPNICLNFGLQFLQHVVTCFAKYEEGTLLRFSWSPGHREVKCIPINNAASEYEFLPSWFS